MFQADAQVVPTNSYVDWKCYAFEDSNYGLQMMRQWDALIDRHQATMYSVPWLSPDRRFIIMVRDARGHPVGGDPRHTGDGDADAEGQCILHSAMLKGEPGRGVVAVQYPELLAVTDDQRDSPVIIVLKELSAALRHHKPSDKTAWKRAKLAEFY